MAEWWERNPNDGFVPLLQHNQTNPNEFNEKDEQQLGMIQLRPPKSKIRAMCVLEKHNASMDDDSLSILGGILIRLNYLTREHKEVPMKLATWFWPSIAFLVYCAFIGVVRGFLQHKYDGLQHNAPFHVLYFAMLIGPLLFNSESFLEKRHFQSETYQTALKRFQDDASALVEELNNVVQLHGHSLQVVDATAEQPDETVVSRPKPPPPGTITLRVQQDNNRNRGSSTPGGSSLPAVSAEFLGRGTPITEISVAAAMYNLLAKGVPVDEWTLGALMMRLRCAHQELRQDGKFKWITRTTILLALLMGIAVDVALAVCFHLEDFVVFAFWWIPVLVLEMLALFLLFCADGRMNGETKHELFGAAVENVSSLALQRHGVELVYKIKPSAVRGVTYGAIKFVAVAPGSEPEQGEASTSEPQLACIV